MDPYMDPNLSMAQFGGGSLSASQPDTSTDGPLGSYGAPGSGGADAVGLDGMGFGGMGVGGGL